MNEVHGILQNGLTIVFLSFMFICFIYFGHLKANASTLSPLLTGFGILGTFIGIAIGLFYFNPNNIDKSIPGLLFGLKFAFITSIVGLFLSLTMKIHDLYVAKHTKAEIIEGATADTIAILLSEIRDLNKASIQSQNNRLTSIENALTGEGEGTVLTQLQKLRLDLTDKLNDLNSSFLSFSEKMAENNSKALIEALSEVIRDFNTKLSEQFGENFKHLNNAVLQLVQWQIQFKQQTENMILQFNNSLKSMEHSRELLSEIASKSSVILESAIKLEPVMNKIDFMIKDLSNHLSAFSELSKQASNAFPIIQRNLDQLTNELSESVKKSIADSTRSFEQQRTFLENQSRSIDTIIKTSTERIANQVTQLDESLGDELNKSITTLGNHLATLSEKFADDYMPLTVKLKEILDICKGLDNR